MLAELEARPPQLARIDKLEALIGSPLTLALRAWFECVDGVNFVGAHPDWIHTLLDARNNVSWANWESTGFEPEAGGHPFSHLEPIYVHSLTHVTSRYRELVRINPKSRLSVLHIPNGNSSYLEIGQDNWDYVITAAPTADARIADTEPEVSFVGCLRRCIRWGGFPGWERLSVRPERDLAMLTKDLIPF